MTLISKLVNKIIFAYIGISKTTNEQTEIQDSKSLRRH